MIGLLRWLVARLAVIPWLLKSVGGLAVLLPIAFVLKLVGLPILIVLAVLAAPILLVLFVAGLPVFLVLLAGGMLLGLLFFALTIGLMALKVFVFVVLPIVLVWKLLRWAFGHGPAGGAGPNSHPGSEHA